MLLRHGTVRRPTRADGGNRRPIAHDREEHRAKRIDRQRNAGELNGQPAASADGVAAVVLRADVSAVPG
jgi:hypothetical protein